MSCADSAAAQCAMSLPLLDKFKELKLRYESRKLDRNSRDSAFKGIFRRGLVMDFSTVQAAPLKLKGKGLASVGDIKKKHKKKHKKRRRYALPCFWCLCRLWMCCGLLVSETMKQALQQLCPAPVMTMMNQQLLRMDVLLC
jgi:hypothetical protein